MFIMPIQLVWGSASSYCAHEAGASAKKHLGHHEHKHQAGGEVTPAADEHGEGAGAYHADCESCNLGYSAALHPSTPEIHALPHAGILSYRGPSYTSHVPSGPHRPDRADPTLAARFGGGVVVVSLAG